MSQWTKRTVKWRVGGIVFFVKGIVRFCSSKCLWRAHIVSAGKVQLTQTSQQEVGVFVLLIDTAGYHIGLGRESAQEEGPFTYMSHLPL